MTGVSFMEINMFWNEAWAIGSHQCQRTERCRSVHLNMVNVTWREFHLNVGKGTI